MQLRKKKVSDGGDEDSTAEAERKEMRDILRNKKEDNLLPPVGAIALVSEEHYVY